MTEWRRAGRGNTTSSSAADFDSSTERQDAWLEIGAREKAASVVQLLAGHCIGDVLEIGAGTGAVLAELDRCSFGNRYYACEPSASLVEQLRRKRISRLCEVQCGFFHDMPLSRQSFDIAILSHVLEHVPNPAKLLSEALAVAPLVLVEIPLDGNVAGNLRARLRQVLRGEVRSMNSAGHVHFWAERDARTLVDAVDARVLGTRRYFPAEAYAALSDSKLRKGIYLTLRIVPERVVSRTYHGHLALLLTAGAGVDPGHSFYAHGS